eukprot:TRINITY_DN69602_c0_g1_i1.p1 TRINITY_DN69602_c0_g1~~TRINITY_DN69602_c0_g1_i1.p1  ORF type:complete len:461 (-),score=61.67 TRINITY_DN69602_c0_g1_i1:73-1365(-)
MVGCTARDMTTHAVQRPLALVLGAGAQGLASALRLWEQGWDVSICARDWLSDTTSSGAGAIWEYPPFMVQPQDKARRWTLASLPCFAACREAAGEHRSGVRLRRSFYYFRSATKAFELYGPFDDWRDSVYGFRDGSPPYENGVAKAGLFSYYFSYVAPVVNMRQYLSWLTDAVGSLPGVSLRHTVLSDVASVESLARDVGADAVINCLGLGAGKVFGDTALYGVRGDLVYVLAPGVEECHNFAHACDEDDPEGCLTYAVPQGDGVIALAGTSQKLSNDQLEDSYRPRQDDDATKRELVTKIITRNLLSFPGAVLPVLFSQGTKPDQGQSEPLVVGSWTGARPQRDGGVRLEIAELQRSGNVRPLRLVHNYGHAGSGIVTSWGCAVDVASLAAKGLSRHLSPRSLSASLAPLAVGSVDGTGMSAVSRAARL